MARSAIASIRFIGDATSAIRAAGDVESRVGRLSGFMKGAVVAAVAAVGSAAVGATGKVIGLAGDLEQSAGAIEAVFKGSAAQMKGLSDAAAQSVGLTKNEYNELAVLLGSQLKNGGTAIEELGTKTNDLIKTGSDLSAMFGGTTADAVSALSSALKGERDPIERYGVSLNQAKIDAEAAALGFQRVGGSLSAEATQAATLSLIMKQTADAHGAFARETDTLAHKQQVLRAEMTNAATAIGEGLLPMATAVLGVVGERLMPVITTAAEGFRDFMLALSGDAEPPPWLAAAVGPFRAFGAAVRAGGDDVTSSGFAGAMERLGLAVRGAYDAVGGLAGVWSRITAAAAPAVPIVVAIRDAVAGAAAGVASWAAGLGGLAGIVASVREAVAPLAPLILLALGPWGLLIQAIRVGMTASEPTRVALGALGGALLDLVKTIGAALAPLAEALGRVLGPALGALAPLVAGAIGGLATAITPAIEGLATRVEPAIEGLATRAVPALQGAVDRVKGAAEALATSPVGTWFDGLRARASSAAEGLGGITGVWSRITAAAAPVLPVIAGIGAALGGFALKTGPLAGGIGPLVSKMAGLTGVFQKLGPAVKFLMGPWGLLISAFTVAMTTSEPFRAAIFGLLGSLGSLGMTLATTLMPVIQNLVTAILPPLMALFPVIVGAVTSLATAVAPVIEMLATTLVPLIGDLVATVLPPLAEAFTGVVGAIVPLVTTIVEQLVPIIVEIVAAVIPPFMELLAAIVPLIPPIVGVIGSLVTTLASALIPIINALLPVVKTVFESISNVIQSVLTIITGIINVFTGILTGDWQKVWDGIKGIFTGIWATIVAIFEGIGKNIGALVTAGMKIVSDLFSTAVDGVAKFFTDMWTNITNSFSSGFTSVQTWVNDLLTKVGNVLSPTALMQTGKDLIQGLINGVGNMGYALSNKIRDLASNAISGFKSMLGISSPSRVFATLGRETGRGYVVGLDREQARVASAIDALVDIPAVVRSTVEVDLAVPRRPLVTTVAAGTAGTAGTAPAGPVVHVEFSGVVGDPIAVAEQIRRVLSTYSLVKEVPA